MSPQVQTSVGRDGGPRRSPKNVRETERGWIDPGFEHGEEKVSRSANRVEVVEAVNEEEVGSLHGVSKVRLLVLHQMAKASAEIPLVRHPVEMDRWRIVEVLILRPERVIAREWTAVDISSPLTTSGHSSCKNERRFMTRRAEIGLTRG